MGEIQSRKICMPGTLTRERYDRLQKLNHLLAQGTYSMDELATRFGVGKQTILNDTNYIYQKWWVSEHREEVRDARLQRVKELEYIKRLALESYSRSRKDKEQVVTRYEKEECEECGGTGRLPKCKCIACEGIGYTLAEVVSRKVEGQAGDNAFLETARKVTMDICKLEALFKQPEVKVQHVISGDVRHTVDLEEKYRDVDPELILEAKVALARLERNGMNSIAADELPGLIVNGGKK